MKFDEINNINDIQSWESIEKCIRYFYRNPQNEFIILYKEDNRYILLSDEEIQNIKANYKCYLLPYYCLDDINYYTSLNAFNGFNALSHYYIINYLYKYRNDSDTYKLLWFTNAIYHIVKNHNYNWFEKCKNYDESFIINVLKHMLKICEGELYKKTDIEHRYIYGQTKNNFSPIESINYDYEYIHKDIDVSNINNIIDYISLMIQEVKAKYRFIVVYSTLDKKIAEMLKNM